MALGQTQSNNQSEAICLGNSSLLCAHNSIGHSSAIAEESSRVGGSAQTTTLRSAYPKDKGKG